MGTRGRPKTGAADLADRGDVFDLSALIEAERRSIEGAMATLSDLVSLVTERIKSGGFVPAEGTQLIQLTAAISSSMERLRKFGDGVRTQSLRLTPEQQMRAIAKYIQTLASAQQKKLRALLDERIADVTLVR